MASVSSPVTFAASDLVKVCTQITVWAAFILGLVGKLIFWTTFALVVLSELAAVAYNFCATVAHNVFALNHCKMPLQEQMALLKVVYQRATERAEAQQEELKQLRLELEQSCLDNEQLHDLVRTLTLTSEDQIASLQRTQQDNTNLKSENAGLAGKSMALRREVLAPKQEKRRLEQEKLDRNILLREINS